MSWPPLQERLLGLLVPAKLMYLGAKSLLVTAIHYYLIERHLPSAANVQKVRDDAFSAFWTKLTAPVYPPPPPVNSETLIPPLLSRAHGVVLDIGPGSGTQVQYLAQSSNITKVYGAEPTTGLHPALRERISEAGLDGRYTILSCPADKRSLVTALSSHGVKVSSSGVFDTIVCVRVLCSVPHIDQTARELYELLKPGGELMVVEHVRNPWPRGSGSWLARGMQVFYHLIGWRFIMGGCELNRDTASVLRKAGEWEATELKVNFEWSALPYVSGTLTKAR